MIIIKFSLYLFYLLRLYFDAPSFILKALFMRARGMINHMLRSSLAAGSLRFHVCYDFYSLCRLSSISHLYSWDVLCRISNKETCMIIASNPHQPVERAKSPMSLFLFGYILHSRFVHFLWIILCNLEVAILKVWFHPSSTAIVARFYQLP